MTLPYVPLARPEGKTFQSENTFRNESASGCVGMYYYIDMLFCPSGGPKDPGERHRSPRSSGLHAPFWLGLWAQTRGWGGRLYLARNEDAERAHATIPHAPWVRGLGWSVPFL